MKKTTVAGTAALALMFVTYMVMSIGQPACPDDCPSYTALMHLSGQDYGHTLLSMAWPWAHSEPKFWRGLILRPWAVPLFFSLFGPQTPISELQIVIAQTLLGFLAWLLFALTCASFVSGRIGRTVAFLAVAAMMFGQGYQHSNQYLLSDSLALSSVLIQMSLCLLFSRAAAWCRARPMGQILLVGYVGAIAVASAVEIGTRDANISLALAGAALTLFGSDRRSLLHRLATIAVVVALAVPASISAKERHKFNDENILVGLVLPAPDIKAFFVEHGMPDDVARAGAGLKVQDLSKVDNREIERAKAARFRTLEPFLPRFDGIYVRYLALHPAFVASTIARYWRLVFGQYWVANQTAPPILGAALRLSLTDWLPLAFYPLFPVLFLSRRDLRRRVGYWPALLMMVGAGNAVLGFFGDVWTPSEMARHAHIGSVLMRIGGLICVLFVAENLFTAFRASSLTRRLTRLGTSNADNEVADAVKS